MANIREYYYRLSENINKASLAFGRTSAGKPEVFLALPTNDQILKACGLNCEDSLSPLSKLRLANILDTRQKLAKKDNFIAENDLKYVENRDR